MNTLVDLLNMGLAQRIGWALIHFLWQGAAIAGLLWLALRPLARRGPQARYAAACLALLLMAAAPVATFFVVQPAGQDVRKPAQTSAATYPEDDSWGKGTPLKVPAEFREGTATLEQAKAWCRAMVVGSSFGNGHVIEVEHRELVPGGEQAIVVFDPSCGGSGGRGPQLIFSRTPTGLKFLGDLSGSWRAAPPDALGRPRLVGYWRLGGGEGKASLIVLTSRGFVPVANVDASGGDGAADEQRRTWRTLFEEPVSQKTLAATFGEDASSGTSLPDMEKEPDLAAATAGPVADDAAESGDGQHWTSSVSAWAEPAMPYAVAVWLAGVLACSVWHVGGWLRVQRLRRGAQPLADGTNEGHWRAASDRLSNMLRVRRAVRLLKLTGAAARDLAGPVVLGVLRPAVLIPAAVLTGLTPSQVEAVLAHELAHVRRHDYFVNLLQTLVETLLFYHPAVWWASARIRAERENCCDDLAASAIGNNHAYAAALAALAEVAIAQQPVRPAGILARLVPAARGRRSSADRIAPGARTNLLSRIRRLLGVDVGSSPSWTAALVGMILLTGLLAGIAFYGCVADSAQFDPRPAESTTQTADVSPEALIATSRGEWSRAVNGLQGRLVLKRTHVTNGTPIITTDLELKNVADLGNPMDVAWASERMVFHVADSDGSELPPFMGPFDGMGFGRHDLTLPHDSSIVFDISARGAGIPGDQAAMIDLGPTTSWVIPRDGKQYSLAGTLDIPQAASQPADGSRLWHGKIDLPAVQVPLRTPSLASDVISKLIEKLGARMIERPNTGESEAAADLLSLIDDERVIPWYVKAVAADSSQLRQRALDRLGRFESDAALEGLRIGMKTQAEDVEGDTASPQIAHQAAEGVRHYAAVALARSPNPKAKDLLLTMRNDPYTGVRIVVVQTFGEMDTPKALQLLEEMSRDRDEAVRGEARRYLELRRSRSTTQPVRRDVSVVNWIELVDKDDLPAGMFCRVPPYRTTDHPGAKWVYKHTRDAMKRAEAAGLASQDVLVLPELSARLGGVYTARGTLEVAEQFVQGDTITIRLRYIDEDKDIGRHMEAGNPVHVYGDKQFKSVYLWGYMPKDLPPGKYTVNLELDEYERKNGQLFLAPKTEIRHHERLSCAYMVEPAEAASQPATAQAGQEQSPAQHVWEDYRRALEFLFNGGSRAQAAERFEAIAKRWTSDDDRQLADEARSVARRLRAMADEDRQWKPVADPDKLTGQPRLDYLIHKLRDVAVRGSINPGETHVLSIIVMSPEGVPLDQARMPAVALRKLGKEAVPSLLALLDDTRLTRSSDGPFNGSHILEYRDVAIQILEAIAGRQFLPINATGEYLSTTSQEKHNKAIADAKAWWEANKDRQEHEWLADALLANGIGWSSSSIAAAERLVELRGEKSADVFRRLVVKEPDTPWPLILLHKAGGKSVLEDVRRATKSPNLRIRATAYGILRREGEPGVVKLALADLAALKEMPETKGFGNALLEFLAGCGDDRAALAVAKLMLSPDKHVVVDARAATLQANPADEITPERLRLILPYVAATLDNQALELGYHHMTAQWIIKAARLAIDWPQDPAGYDQALREVQTWWREHKGDYTPATAPSAAGRPAIEQFIGELDAAFNLSGEQKAKVRQWVEAGNLAQPPAAPNPAEMARFLDSILEGQQKAILRQLIESGKSPAQFAAERAAASQPATGAATQPKSVTWRVGVMRDHYTLNGVRYSTHEDVAHAAKRLAGNDRKQPIVIDVEADTEWVRAVWVQIELQDVAGFKNTRCVLTPGALARSPQPKDLTAEQLQELVFAATADHPDPRAVHHVMTLGPMAVKPLATLLHPQVLECEPAKRLLVEIGAPAVPGLIEALSDGDAPADQIARVLGQIGDAKAVAPLVSLLQSADSDRLARAAAAWALGQLGDRSAVVPLIAALRSADCDVRDDAAQALGNLGDTKAIAPLETAEAALSPDENTLSAATSLGHIRNALRKLRARKQQKEDFSEAIESLWKAIDRKAPAGLTLSVAMPSEPMLIAPKGYPQANESIELRYTRTGDDKDATVILAIMKRGYTGKPLAGAAERAEEIATWRGRRVFFWGGGNDWPTAKADILAALKATDAPAVETQPATQPVQAQWSRPVNGLRVRIDAGRYLTKRLGMEVGVQFENTSDQPVSVDFGELQALSWKVLDADSKEVEPAKVRRAEPAPSWYSISPGEQVGRILGTSQQNRDERLVIGFYEWQLKPGRYSIHCTLALQSDAAGLPEGQTAWKGKLDLPPAEFEVIDEVSDDDLRKAAGVVKAVHFPTLLAQWEYLAKLVQPGMTVRQMYLVLPPKRMTLEEMGEAGTIWNGNFFIHRYWLDDSYAVEASGIGTAPVVALDRGATQPASAPANSVATQPAASGDDNMILTSRAKITRLAPPATQPASAPAAGDAEWMKRHLAGFDEEFASYVKSWSAEPKLPADSAYADKTIEELSRIIVEEVGGAPDTWEPLYAFVLKTKEKPEARKALAASLLAKVDEIRATGKWSVCLYQHGQWHALLLLGDRPSVLKLMEGERLATCCGCDALMMRVVAFGQREDAWALLRHFAKDGAEGWLHHLNGCMVRLTGAKRIPTGAITDKPYNEAFQRQAIKAWEVYLLSEGIKPPQPTTAPTPSTQPASRPAESQSTPTLDEQQVEYLLNATRPGPPVTLKAPRIHLYDGSKGYIEMRHFSPASRPAPTSQPGKATLDGEPVDGLGKSLTIQHQAATLADLVAKAKPDFTFGDDGRDMMWIEGKDTDKPSFRLRRAFMYRPVDGDAGFVLLESNFEGGPPDDAVSVVRCIAPPSVARLLDERPVHDGGSGDYAIVKSRGPSGAVLYEIGWQSEYLANWAKERRLYVLRTGDKWAFVGEGPAEGYSKMGYCQQVGTAVDARVEWTQKPDAPVRMHFVATETRSEWASSDMLQEDPSASDAMRDDLVKRWEWVLQGKLPATLQAVSDRSYMLARRGDNLDKLVRHLSSWTPGARESALKIQTVWKRELTRSNADLFAGEIPEGRRINLPTDAEMAKLISP